MTSQANVDVATAAAARSVLDEIEKAVVGKRDALTLILTTLLARGHVLIEDCPASARRSSPGPSPPRWV